MAKTDFQIIGDFAFRHCAWLMLHANWGKATLKASLMFSEITDSAQAKEDISIPLAKFIKFYNKVKPKLP